MAWNKPIPMPAVLLGAGVGAVRSPRADDARPRACMAWLPAGSRPGLFGCD